MATAKFTIKGSNGRTHTSRTIVPDTTPRLGSSHAFRTIAAEFKGRYLSGSGHGFAIGSAKKLMTAINHFNIYMMKREGLQTGDSVKKAHVDRFIEHLQTQPSLLTGRKQLCDKSIKDILSGTRKILTCYGKGHMLNTTYEAKGLAVGHKEMERPIDFMPDRQAARADLQQKYEQCRNKSYAVQSQLGQAFGLREAGRVESRDTIKYVDGQLNATRGASAYRPVTERQIAGRYGKSAVARLDTVFKSGAKEFLIVENEKGGRTRFLPIDNDDRRAAIDRVQDYIRNTPGHSVYRKSYPDGTTTQQAERNYTRIQERYGANRDNQLSSHCDRHWEAQRLYQECLDKGLPRKAAEQEVVIQMGHNDQRKVRYYIRI
jgi:hypothetical protein